MDSIQRSQVAGRFRKFTPEAKAFISSLRKNSTRAESRLWSLIRMNQLEGFRFRRQHKIGRFITDFYCPQALLAVEVDGDVHAMRQREDHERDQWISSWGIRILRFSNDDVFLRPAHVCDEILKAARQRTTSKASPLPLARGRGRGLGSL